MPLLKIEQAKLSQSGKTMGLLAGGTWYASKDHATEQLVGQTIDANVAQQTFPDGGSMWWINDYTIPGTVGAPSPGLPAVAGNAAGVGSPGTQQPPAPAAPSPTPNPTAEPDRANSIIAQALVKACQPGTIEKAVEAYWYALKMLQGGPASVSAPVPEPPPGIAPPQGEFNDNIPF